MNEEYLAICRVCMEPVTNSICSDCLYKQTKKWLSSESKHLVSVVADVRKNLMESFPDTMDNKQKCISCMKEREHVICPYCFVRDVYHSLRKKDPMVAKEFAVLFNFDFEDIGLGKQYRCNHTPLDFGEEELEECAICDLCGNASALLYGENGMLVCDSCRDEN